MYSDEELMHAIRAEDMLPFDALYMKYSARVFNLTISLLKKPDKAGNLL